MEKNHIWAWKSRTIFTHLTLIIPIKINSSPSDTARSAFPSALWCSSPRSLLSAYLRTASNWFSRSTSPLASPFWKFVEFLVSRVARCTWHDARFGCWQYSLSIWAAQLDLSAVYYGLFWYVFTIPQLTGLKLDFFLNIDWSKLHATSLGCFWVAIDVAQLAQVRSKQTESYQHVFRWF